MCDGTKFDGIKFDDIKIGDIISQGRICRNITSSVSAKAFRQSRRSFVTSHPPCQRAHAQTGPLAGE
jgi:hypothetical protein